MSKRRYANRRGSLGKGFMIFMIVVILAIGTGYGLTEYVITPYILGVDKQEQQEDEPPQQELEGSSIIIDQQNVKPGDEETSAPVADNTPPVQQEAKTGNTYASKELYSIQYGSYSDLAGAEAVASSLAASNIDVMVMQTNGAFKLIGAPYLTKEEARNSLEAAKAVAGNDIFVTAVEVRMQ